MSTGQLVLHRFNGDEIYHLRLARMQLDSVEGRNLLTFTVFAQEEAVQTCPDTAPHPTTPNCEATFLLDDFNEAELVGRQFLLPMGYDEILGNYPATFYYYDHQDLNNNVIEVLHQDSDGFYVRWTATTEDVNFYDGSKPDTRIEIEGLFTFEDRS
jgi:hypothetical protein